MHLRRTESHCLCWYEFSSENDEEAYEMGVSKAFKPIMENTLKYLNVGKSSDSTSKADYSKVPNVEGQEMQKQRIA